MATRTGSAVWEGTGRVLLDGSFGELGESGPSRETN